VNGNEMAALLGELVAIPTVSSDPSRRGDILRSAQLIAAQLEARGFETVVAHNDGALPTVIATRGVRPRHPTVILYSHHDVQPTGDPGLWESDPFEATRRGSVIFGRGSGDNKAGIVAHLAAIEALDRRAGAAEPGTAADVVDPPGLVVVIDGGEEIGSPGFDAVLEAHLTGLDPDLIVVNDGINVARGIPSLTTSLRGMLAVDVTVSVMDEPTHSGIHGGGVVDAIAALARLIATVHTDDGSVAVAGLDAIGTHTGSPLSEAEFRDRLGLYDGVRVTGANALTGRLWASTAISVIGIDAPGVAESSNVVVPSARARLSVRLPPGIGLDAASDALRTHLRAHTPFGARVDLQFTEGTEPWSAAGQSSLVRDALAAAWGADVVEMGGGGGIPVVSAFAAAFPRAAIAITAICDPDSSVHGINENVDLVELERAAAAEAAILRAFAQGRAQV
jgi:acetylornithine deacetylase/succinyl-diaminopimelate desuccinylase-like protein